MHETITGSYSGKAMSWCSQEERNIPFLCSVVLPCLIVLQQNNFSTSCAILNCKKEKHLLNSCLMHVEDHTNSFY